MLIFLCRNTISGQTRRISMRYQFCLYHVFHAVVNLHMVQNFASSTVLQINFNQALTGNSYCTFETVRSNAGSSLFHKVDRFFGPSSTWTVQISLDNVDAGMPLA